MAGSFFFDFGSCFRPVVGASGRVDLVFAETASGTSLSESESDESEFESVAASGPAGGASPSLVVVGRLRFLKLLGEAVEGGSWGVAFWACAS